MPTGHEWRSLIEDGEFQFSRTRVSRGFVLTSASIILIVASLILWPILQFKVSTVNAGDATPTPTHPVKKTEVPASPSPTPEPTNSPTANFLQLQEPQYSTPTPRTESISSPLQQGLVILSIYEAGFSHLFAYQDFAAPLTRLTSGPWNDITPAMSPDGRWIAFASDRSGPWDLYLLDLENGEVVPLTDSPHFEAAPSWSPDGSLIAYESFEQDFEIKIRSAFDDQVLINLSQHPAADFQPAWSPIGRQMAFVSNRSGEPEIWLADFDKSGDDRFTNVSMNPEMQETNPTWSPNGQSLAWSALAGRNHSLFAWNQAEGGRYVGSGDWPAWSPDGQLLLTTLLDANQTLITAYQASDSMLVLPPAVMPGQITGLSWGSQTIPSPLPSNLQQVASETLSAPWVSGAEASLENQNSGEYLAPLNNVQAPFPQLHDAVDEAYQALRERVAQEAGWDFLATIENAFVPLTSPLPPGMGDDWLYTGRAFAFDPLPMNAGWVVVVPELFGDQTFWRVYLKARFQEGAHGQPMRRLPWNFNARYENDPLFYEQGGEMAFSIPEGYWIDFTQIAQAYGWHRLPALPTWQSAYFAARFNEFYIPSNKSWQEAMLELYPAEALLTPTPILPPTLTPTRTPSWPIVSTPSP